jgi:hypothetical protein
MHGAEDDPVFNGPQQFFVGFQKGRKTVEVGRRDPEGLCVRSIPPTSDTVAVLAIALIHAFAACDIGWKILCMEERCDKEADEAHAQRGCHATKENTHHTSYTAMENFWSVWSIWFVLFIWLGSLNQKNQMNQIDQITVFLRWGSFSACCQLFLVVWATNDV